jgi:drug/metabolite transporter (DMT)-like permease
VATGLTFTGLGLGGMFIGGGKIPPGLATVVANTQPLIAAVLAAIFLSERLTLGVGIGLLLGFVGVLVMSVPSLLGPNSVADLQAFVWIILGAVGTAMGNVLLKALTGRADVLMVTGLQLLVGAMALAVGAQAVGTSWHIAWTSQFIASLIGLVVFGTALMTALWHYLLTQASLNRLNTFTFLTPIFGLLLGGLFFDERFGWIQAVGIGVTILAIQLVATKPSPTR